MKKGMEDEIRLDNNREEKREGMKEKMEGTGLVQIARRKKGSYKEEK